MQKIILIDQDNVIADFEQGVRDFWLTFYGEHLPVAPHERNSFFISDDFPELYEKLATIFALPQLFRTLKPIDGAIEAIRILEQAGNKVFICTSPIDAYQHCVTEKFAWVAEHLGVEWINKLIITKDKTLIYGDILIDDKPEILGCRVPTWKHWIYHQTYNANINNGLPKVRWSDKATWQGLMA